MNLKVEEDQELIIAFTAVTWISAKRHFWRNELRSWCLVLGLVFRVEYKSFMVEDDLRTLCLRKYTKECTRGEQSDYCYNEFQTILIFSVVL